MITFLLDHPSRDLLPYALIIAQLDFKGQVDFQDGYFTPEGPNFFKRILPEEKIIVTPSYNITRTPYLRLRMLYKRSKLIMLHSEQFLAPVSYYEKFNLDNFEKFNKDVFLHFVWNKSFGKLLIDNGVSAQKIRVVGNPKFDILKLIKEQGSGLPENNILLFITNFNAADFSDEQWQRFKKEYFLPDDDKSNVLYKNIRNSFIKNLKSLEPICKSMGKQIVIRKHPGELPDQYLSIESDCIKLSVETDLYKDLRKAEMLFQYTSSVAFESFILDIPTYAVKWGEIPSELMQPPSQDFVWIEPNEIEALLVSKDKSKQAVSKEMFYHYFGEEKELSSTLIANELNKIWPSIEHSSSKSSLFPFLSVVGVKFLIKYIVNVFSSRTNNFLSRFLKKKVKKSYLAWLQNDHYCSEQEISDAINYGNKILRK